MDSIFEISLLMDFYGQLITNRQYHVLDLYYNNDYSLGEIAELLDISRQGVYDNLKKGKKLLSEYEKKLGLVEKFIEQKARMKEALKLANTIPEEELSKRNKESLEKIKKILGEIDGII